MSERVSYSKVLLVFATVLASLGVDFGLSNVISTLLLELPNTRKQEYEGEADQRRCSDFWSEYIFIYSRSDRPQIPC